MDSSMTPTVTTSFHCFPRLPFELRRIIWGLAVVPRIITCAGGPKAPYPEDTSVYEGDPWEGFDWYRYTYGTAPPPPLLQTCVESRSVAISDGLYRPALRPSYLRLNQAPRYSWVNYELDTIQIATYLLKFLYPEDKAEIRRMIVEGGDEEIATERFARFNVEGDISHMQALQELRISTGDHLGAWKGAFRDLQARLEERFGGKPGWVPPKITIIHKITGEQADESNIDDQHRAFLTSPGPRGRRW